MDAVNLFETWTIPSPVRDALLKQGIQTPSEMQSLTIPKIMAGKDILGVAGSGTGKTLAYCLPLITLLDKDENRDKIGLVITPNQEIAYQVHDTIKKLTSKMTGRWKPVMVTPDTEVGDQEEGLRKRPRMIVATPEQLLSHIETGIAKLDNVGLVVLENTNVMIETGLDKPLKKIFEVLPEEKQMMMFTESSDRKLKAMAKKVLNDPETLEVKEAKLPELVAPVETESEEEPGQFELFVTEVNELNEQIIVFCRTKFRARKLAQKLNKAGIPTDCFYKDRSSYQRQNTLDLFNQGELKVLLTSDALANEVMIDKVDRLGNFDLETLGEEYEALITKENNPFRWLKLESIDQWKSLQEPIMKAGVARIDEIKKQKEALKESGEYVEKNPKKKKNLKNQNQKKKSRPNYDIADEDRQPNFDNVNYDDDSQPYFQPSVEEQLMQLDSMTYANNRNSYAKRGSSYITDDNFGNMVGPSNKKKKNNNHKGQGRGGHRGGY